LNAGITIESFRTGRINTNVITGNYVVVAVYLYALFWETAYDQTANFAAAAASCQRQSITAKHTAAIQHNL
jgi:hypothetical protein